MKEIWFGAQVGLHHGKYQYARNTHGTRTGPTPSEFLAGVGRVLAVCFGLALLAHALVAVIGVQ